MDNACVIIGEANRAGAIKKMLSTSDVPTAAIAHNTGHEAIVSACAKLRSLAVVAVLCRDFPQDVGLSLFTELRKGLPESVGLHAFVEDREALRSIREDFKDLDVEILCNFPLEPFKVASTIKQQWFGNGVQRDRKASDGNGRNGSAKVSVPGARVVSFEGGRPVLPVPSVRAPEPRVVSKVFEEPSEKSAPAKQPKVSRVRLPEQQGIATIGDSMSGFLDEILKGFRKNAPLSSQPVPLSIVGMNGRSVELDPRRIKPLPAQPRQESNPGFTKESLTGLGNNIKLIGQMEEILVCPMVGDPDYDAQLINGERRKRSTELVGIHVWAKVREDVSPNQARQLYFMSVVCNEEPELFTTYDNVKIVRQFRKEFEMTNRETAEACRKTTGWVSQHELLGRLHPDVLEMLDGGSDSRTLTSQIAQLLPDVPTEGQRAAAETIVTKKMNYNQARRYVLNLRRGLKLAPTVAGRTRPSRQFDALRTLIKRNLDAVGIYLDMPTAEVLFMLSHQTAGEKSGVSEDLRTLAKNLYDLAIKIEKV